MIWVTIILVIILLSILTRLYNTRKLTLNDLKELVQMTEEERLQFLRKRMYNVVTGDSLKNDYWLDRWSGDDVFFPHDNKTIEERNELRKLANKLTGSSLDQVKKVDKQYFGYRLKSKSGRRFLNKMILNGFSIVENPDFEKEGFGWLRIEKEEIDGKKVFISNRNFSQYWLYSDGDFGIIHRVNISDSNNDWHFFTIYLLE